MSKIFINLVLSTALVISSSMGIDNQSNDTPSHVSKFKEYIDIKKRHKSLNVEFSRVKELHAQFMDKFAQAKEQNQILKTHLDKFNDENFDEQELNADLEKYHQIQHELETLRKSYRDALTNYTTHKNEYREFVNLIRR